MYIYNQLNIVIYSVDFLHWYYGCPVYILANKIISRRRHCEIISPRNISIGFWQVVYRFRYRYMFENGIARGVVGVLRVKYYYVSTWRLRYRHRIRRRQRQRWWWCRVNYNDEWRVCVVVACGGGRSGALGEPWTGVCG